MQPLSPFEVYLNIFIAVVFPLLIVRNLVDGERSPRNSYLWRHEADLMRVSLIVIGILWVWTLARLAIHFQVLTRGAIQPVMLILAIPFGIAAVAEIWLGTGALLRYMRNRPSRSGQ